jgi:hypothetical protein
MYPFGGILIAPLVAGYLTSLICRLLGRRYRRPSWFTVPLAVVVSVSVVWVATFQTDLFVHSRWLTGKVPMWDMLLISGVPSASLGAVAAILVLYHYLRKYERTHPGV